LFLFATAALLVEEMAFTGTFTRFAECCWLLPEAEGKKEVRRLRSFTTHDLGNYHSTPSVFRFKSSLYTLRMFRHCSKRIGRDLWLTDDDPESVSLLIVSTVCETLTSSLLWLVLWKDIPILLIPITLGTKYKENSHSKKKNIEKFQKIFSFWIIQTLWNFYIKLFLLLFKLNYKFKIKLYNINN